MTHDPPVEVLPPEAPLPPLRWFAYTRGQLIEIAPPVAPPAPGETIDAETFEVQ